MTTIFRCEICNYKTKSGFNYNRHINSSKHKKKVCPQIIEKKTFVCECGKKNINSKVVYQNININVNLYLKKNFKLLLLKKMKEIELLKAELADLKNQQEQDQSVILEAVNTMAKNHSELTEATKKIAENAGSGNNYTDCYNQKMTINVFLNEECKNAMNLTDFVDQFKVSLEDLQYTRDNGFAQGITNIFTKQLKDMDPTTRPIHCSDSKDYSSM